MSATTAVCSICPRHCRLAEGQTGFCGARKNDGGEVVCSSYGRLTSLSLDPIEKKPLARFLPGTKILSAGSYGCNLNCQFCQNHDISMLRSGNANEAINDTVGDAVVYVSPEALVCRAKELVPRGNSGIALTYNEPVIAYEYALDCTRLAKQFGLATVLVTNGYVCEEPMNRLLDYTDAMNIDLKAFTQRFYSAVGGELEEVKRTIELCSKRCHVEVTTLIVPDENDSAEEMRELSAWLASVDDKIPLHVSRFFPRYNMLDREPTPPCKVYELADVAREKLKYVYTGNC